MPVMNPQLQLMLKQAIQAFQGGNLNGADLILHEVLQNDINSADAIFELGIAYAKANRLMEALAVFYCLHPYKNDDARIPYNLGLIHSLQGENQLALGAYDLALKIQPNDAEVLINQGSTYNEINNYVLALEALEKAIQIRPDIPEAWSNKGIALNNLNLYEESIHAYNEAIMLAPSYHEAWSNKSVPLNKLKRFTEASDACDKALNIKPDYPEAWFNKGVTLHELKRFDEAIAHYDKALSLKPDYAEGWSNKGVTLHELKRFDEAIAHYDKALSLKPDYAEAYSNKGNTLNELKRFDEAIAHYDKALNLKPDYHEAWSNKSVPLNTLKRFTEASDACDKALSLKPNYAEAWSNKGMVFYELMCYDEAIAHYDKALSLKPNYHEAWSNKGVTLHALKRFDEAIAHYDKALSLKPEYHDASWNKSISLLLLGNFENGLPLYESRWDSDKVSEIVGKRFFDEPSWLGAESLQGKNILLYGEQGLGDFIQFCRYVKLVSDLGAKIILETPEPLASLMENLEGVSQLVIKGDELPSFDYQCPLLSLPMALSTDISSIPADIPYLAAHPNKVAEWNLRLGKKRKQRIGLVWSSMSDFKDDSKRSLMLFDFIQALPSEGFEYVCLQKELKDCDKKFFENYKNIRFFGGELVDFSDTAALIENLDLVISTCTSIPHLSGALGKKTWILLSYVPDWRWLLDRQDSPWYQSVKLYRQTAIGDWGSVLDKVKFDLHAS